MQTLEKILNSILPVFNPQGEEKRLADEILSLTNSITFPMMTEIDFDPNWGLYFKIESPESSKTKNGVLFLGHMDSDDHNQTFTIENGITNAKSEIGLDNKAGLTSILYALHLIKEQNKSYPYDIHVYFSVMEEVGQKGAMYFPLDKIKENVRYGISVDRKTNANGGGGVRHFINSYHGVPMLIPGDSQFIENSLECKGIVSPNCADIIEIRGRYDAEVIYPILVAENDDKLKEYNTWITKIKSRIEDKVNPLPLEQAVSSMNQSPRRDRYDAMKTIYGALYNGNLAIPEKYNLSVVNLSIDFNDPKISLQEIQDTSTILLNFLDKYSQN